MRIEETRPDPEMLLARLKKEESGETGRGKLRIYLGYAAGVGKTYTMLQAAHEAVQKGEDVAAGYIEPHVREDTSQMAEGLDTIPPLMVSYKGVKLREFDLDAALKRHPKICLVDELAHTNAPGLRHPKRYMDIGELLDAGIDVWTTVNIQHLESLNDKVGGITGITVREKFPDRVFDHADQVKVIDIEPEELLARLAEGKIYRKEQAERAGEHFFTKEKLTALRELALRRTADRVNHLAVEEKKSRQQEGDYFTGEHVLTCISPSPTCAKVIRSASRLAFAFHAEFTALNVETPGMAEISGEARQSLESNIRLARALGAKTAAVYGEDPAAQIAAYAKAAGVSKIVLGRTNHRIILGRMKGTIDERVAQLVPDADIYIIPDVTPAGKRRALAQEDFAHKMTAKKHIFIDTAGITAAACAVTFVIFRIFGIRMSKEHVLLLFVMAFIAATLLTTVRRQSRELVRKSCRLELLLENSSRLRRCITVKDVENEVAGQIVRLMNLSVIFYLRGGGESAGADSGPDIYPAVGADAKNLTFFREQQERATALWVLNSGRRAGCTSDSLPGAKALYLPVKLDKTVYAAVGIYLEESREIPAFEYGIITAMLNEAALAFAKRYGDFWENTDATV